MPLTPLGRRLRTVLVGLRNVTRDGSKRRRDGATETTAIIPTGPVSSPQPPAWPARPYYKDARCNQRAAHELAPASVVFERLVALRPEGRIASAKPGTRPDREEPHSGTGDSVSPRASAITDVEGAGQGAICLGFPWERHRSANTLAALNHNDIEEKTLKVTLVQNDDTRSDAQGARSASRGSMLASVSDMLAGILHEQVMAHSRPDALSLQLGDAQMELLEKLGYRAADLEQWARLLMLSDSLDVAASLAERFRLYSPRATPMFVYLLLLRRQYISARALRVLVKLAEDLLMARATNRSGTDKTSYHVFRGLMYHARKVWPAASTRITQLLLDDLASQFVGESTTDPDHVNYLTFILNRALCHIVVPTAIEPIKNNAYQEAALIKVLEFLDRHQPILQITREGYRSVVLLQLAQRKTEKEQQWAELKALSWPPWKEERTAMDGYINADDHGHSKAAATLLRMREAGFRPSKWEQTAMIYAGWDADRTPTIQTLTLLGMRPGSRFSSGTAVWAGRIDTTRTAQEAWAAFLAYEDGLKAKGVTAPDQEVHLALIRKLHEDSRRRANGGSQLKESARYVPPRRASKAWAIHPGDVKEVWPLPPSTHLHTYTRSEIPSMPEIYERMKQSGTVPQDHCLAYFVANAASLAQGFRWVAESAHGAAMTRSLLELDRHCDVDSVPQPICVAFINLLCRFSRVPLATAVQYDSRSKLQVRTPQRVLKSRTLTTHTGITHAIALLQWLRPLHLPPYNTILQRLGQTSSHQNLRSVASGETAGAQWYWKEISVLSDSDQQRDAIRGAITAYRLGRNVLSLMRSAHLELDIDSFKALCHLVENAAFSSWVIMCEEEGQEHHAGRQTPHLHEALEWLRSSSHAKSLRGKFRVLVGDTTAVVEADVDGGRSVNDEDNMPLEVPSYSLLHTYARALGWMADYDGLLQTVRWMKRHAAALATRQKQDRNGVILMHRTFCALRVFLERSWISVPAGGDLDDPRPRLAMQLRRLRSPASPEVLEEVKELVDGVETWGGWPDDEDVARYWQSNERFTRAL